MSRPREDEQNINKANLQGLYAVIDAAGSQAELARALGISPAAIGKWRYVPASRIIEVEEKLGVPRETQRPDLYRVKVA